MIPSPSRAKKLECDVAKRSSVPKELVEHFLTGPMTGEAINAAGPTFKQALIEASLNAELSHHLGYQPGAEKPEGAINHRHGGTSKTVLTGEGELCMATPRERNGSFEPVLLPKHARRFTAFDDSLIAVRDGLTGMPAALEAVFPRTTQQTCIVHLIRNSLDDASWKDRRMLAKALRPIYAAASAEAAAWDAFADGEWGRKFPTVVAA